MIRKSWVRSPPGLATLVEIDHEYGHSFPPADSRRAAVSLWRKNVHKYWLETKHANEKCGYVNCLVLHDLNSVDWAVQLQPNPSNHSYYIITEGPKVIPSGSHEE